LLEFKWDKDTLVESFLAKPNAILLRAGALQGDSGDLDPARMNTDFYCVVTYEEVPYSQTLSMGCGTPGTKEHRYSLVAWGSFLHTQVEGGASCLFARCLAWM
jgi:hypothetical protein